MILFHRVGQAYRIRKFVAERSCACGFCHIKAFGLCTQHDYQCGIPIDPDDNGGSLTRYHHHFIYIYRSSLYAAADVKAAAVIQKDDAFAAEDSEDPGHIPYVP